MKIVRIGRLAALLLAGPLLAGSAAHAAPTCLDRNGGTVRCATPGAMPVGWTPSPGDMGERLGTRPGDLRAGGMIGLTLFLAGLFGLIALLPDFEGRWDGQDADDEEARG
jgi:hypothetical protein